jgi:hypothetical protein
MVCNDAKEPKMTSVAPQKSPSDSPDQQKKAVQKDTTDDTEQNAMVKDSPAKGNEKYDLGIELTVESAESLHFQLWKKL